MTRRAAIALGLAFLATAGCAPVTAGQPVPVPQSQPAGPQYNSGDRMGGGGGGGGM
jgi:hypothetical protein